MRRCAARSRVRARMKSHDLTACGLARTREACRAKQQRREYDTLAAAALAAQFRMPRVGRSSDSRGAAKQPSHLFAPFGLDHFTDQGKLSQQKVMALTERLAERARSQRRGRPGFAPGSLFVSGQKSGCQPPTHVRSAGNIVPCSRPVKSRSEKRSIDRLDGSM
jgi:hypothetical protein